MQMKWSNAKNMVKRVITFFISYRFKVFDDTKMLLKNISAVRTMLGVVINCHQPRISLYPIP
jgi:hypothetical protein